MMRCGAFLTKFKNFLGNRPKMFAGIIGGHCVIPNLDLIHNQNLNLIKELNNLYEKKLKNKRYKKS